MKTLRKTGRLFDCGECGKRTGPNEFHSYESCILYLLEHNPARINDQHRSYLWEAGRKAMQERHDHQELAK